LSGITIKNLTIQGFNNGIGLPKTTGNFILNNTIQDVNRGISLDPQATGNTITGNTILTFNNAGIYLFNASGNFIRGNAIDGDHPVGIWIQKGSNNQVTGNRITGADVGIQLDTDVNKVIRNTVNDAIAPLDGYGFSNATYNNNFLGYTSAFQNSNKNNQTVNTTSPLLGNFWHGYDTDPEGCYDLNLDLICDTSYQLLNQNSELAGVDNFPWKKTNGWHPIQITAPVAPQLTGTPIVVSAAFSDLDVLTAGKHTAEWDWGDGTTSTGTVSEALVDGKVVGTVAAPVHVYPGVGIFELKLKISESYYMSYVEKVFQYIVIYDPDAGFVTGGGRFDSPPGAYAEDLELVGQATFGFISKYHKGATVPEGQTVFEFQAGDLYFKSFTYDFLVLKDGKGTFKGTGTINDVPGYSFYITAIDGEVHTAYDFDTFRIRIWETDTGYWIYDNQMGAQIDADSTTRLIEGSIIIQIASTRR
jgi:parallel beta-helix repeat protein